MTALDRLIPTPRLHEFHEIELARPPEQVWQAVRHGNLAHSRLVRALFALRTLPDRLTGSAEGPTRLQLDALVSTPEQPGFQVLADDPPHEVAVGAIGKVWKLDIPFVHVTGAEAFASFHEPDYIKVAWAVRLAPRAPHDTQLVLELRVDATDDDAWRKFRAYFALIGPASRFIRRSLLAGLARELGTPDAQEDERNLAGDELLPDAIDQATHGITIAATPAQIWPWLVQMGCGRAGFYSYDVLDNGARRSAREIHPELQRIAVGDVLPAAPESDDGFEVLRVDAPYALVLGGLFDPAAERQLPFATARPPSYWHATWAFVLEPLDATHTRLHVRARVACPEDRRTHLAWIRFVHPFMERAQLRHLAQRVEGRLRRDDARDVLEGAAGALRMFVALLTPFGRTARSHWGVSAADAERSHPGDELVPAPRWTWTHGIEIEARAQEVWPWIAQIGSDKAGFYSYQWLENIAGCNVRNAETLHPEWQLRAGDALRLHPDLPGLQVVDLQPGRYFVAYGAPDERARSEGRSWVAASWLFALEPLGPSRCRMISRYRAACSDDLPTRLSFGPTFVEPVGFTMDRRMLLGIKQRAEAFVGAQYEPPARTLAAPDAQESAVPAQARGPQ